MATASQSMLSASSCAFPSCTTTALNRAEWPRRRNGRISFSAGAASSSPEEKEDDCNAEECAPDKEVEKLSVEWLAGEKTRTIGTYPPKKKGWTGYVEKDTAGQTNIYSVEPAVYIAESAISSGTAGSSSDGAENTAAIVFGLALISVAAASSVLLQVDKNAPQTQTMEYSGRTLSYYVNKFKTVSSEATAPEVVLQDAPSVQGESQSEVSEAPQIQVEMVEESNQSE